MTIKHINHSDTKMLVYCRACRRTYDGNAQCCMDMDHVNVTFREHIDEIREFIKPNEELLMHLTAVEKDIERLREKEDMYDWLSGEVGKLIDHNEHLRIVADKNMNGYISKHGDSHDCS